MVLYFIGVYIINRTLHSRLEIRNFSSSVEKYFTSERSERVKYLQHEERNFVSPHGHVISSMCYIICHKNLRDRNVPIYTLKVNYSKTLKIDLKIDLRKPGPKRLIYIPHTKTGTIELKHWHNV